MCVGFIYFNLTGLANVNRQNLFKNVENQNTELILLFVKKNNLQKLFYDTFFKLFFTCDFKMKIL